MSQMAKQRREKNKKEIRVDGISLEGLLYGEVYSSDSGWIRFRGNLDLGLTSTRLNNLGLALHKCQEDHMGKRQRRKKN